MAQTDFDVVTTIPIALIPGTLSGTGTKFLRISGTGTYDARLKNVSQSDMRVSAYMRGTSTGFGLYLRLVALSPLTAYRVQFRGDNNTCSVIKNLSGGSAIFLSTVPVGFALASNIFEARATLIGGAITVEIRRPPQTFSTLISVTDGTPVPGNGSAGFRAGVSSGTVADFDDWALAPAA